MEEPRARLGILVGPRGRGSNMRAIVNACRDGQVAAEVALVLAPAEESPALESARGMGIPVAVVLPGEEFGPRLRTALLDANCNWLCLAGYLRLVPPEVLDAFPNRVLNIHPALLPKFGGKGMYGSKVHEAVIAAGEHESGCTVHWVNEQYDEGNIVLQRRIAVHADDTPETLAGRVLEEEHLAYPEALRRLLGGRD